MANPPGLSPAGDRAGKPVYLAMQGDDASDASDDKALASLLRGRPPP